MKAAPALNEDVRLALADADAWLKVATETTYAADYLNGDVMMFGEKRTDGKDAYDDLADIIRRVKEGFSCHS